MNVNNCFFIVNFVVILHYKILIFNFTYLESQLHLQPFIRESILEKIPP